MSDAAEAWRMLLSSGIDLGFGSWRLIAETLGLPILLGCFAWLWLRRPAAAAGLERLVGTLSKPAGRVRTMPLVVAAIAFGGCALYASWHGGFRPLVPDEFCYLLGAETLAHGRLANEPHDLWRHFEARCVLQQPTYQSKYPPGQSAVLALGLVLGNPALGVWLGVAALAAAMSWMLLAWVSPRWAFVGGLVVSARFGLGTYWAQSYWGGAVAFAAAALAYGASGRLTSERHRPLLHGGLLGLGLGVLANVRPYEGFFAGLAVAVLGISWLRGRLPRQSRRPDGAEIRKVALAATAMLAPALAFVAVYNARVTGDPLTLPHQLYGDRYMVAHQAIFKPLRSEPPQGPPEMVAVYQAFARRLDDYPSGAVWTGPKEAWSRFSSAVEPTLGPGLVVVLVMPLLVGVASAWTRPVALAFGIAFSCHLFVHSYFLHYAAPSLPLLVLLAILGAERLTRWQLRGRPAGKIVVGAALALQAVPVVFGLTMPERTRDWEQERHEIEARLAADGRRHLVFVRYGAYHLPEWEWVYNGAELDEERVLWARDLGDDRNRELMKAFPESTPWLVVVDGKYRGPAPIGDQSSPAAVGTDTKRPPRPPAAELRPYPPE